MIYDIDKQCKLIKQLETSVTIIYILIIGMFLILGIAIKHIIIMTILGFIISWIYTIRTKIKIQEMKWQLDIYNKIINTKNFF